MIPPKVNQMHNILSSIPMLYKLADHLQNWKHFVHVPLLIFKRQILGTLTRVGITQIQA